MTARTMLENEERRVVVGELRVATEGEAPKITGHAAVFNSLSENLGGFREKIAPGAFSRTLREGADVRALVNHDPNLVIGRSRSGTLRMEEDNRGLRVEIDPPDTQAARDLMTSIRRGDIDQMSFAFRTVKDSWETDAKGDEIRTLHDLDLHDVSAVVYPAYPSTKVAVRSLERAKAERQRDPNAARRRMLDLAELDG